MPALKLFKYTWPCYSKKLILPCHDKELSVAVEFCNVKLVSEGNR